MSGFAKFYFLPGENERVETEVTLEPDKRAILHGVVRSTEGRPVFDAAVLLFESGRLSEEQVCVAQGFTDDNGRFVLGPLSPGQLYLVKIYKNMVRLRELEIVAEQ